MNDQQSVSQLVEVFVDNMSPEHLDQATSVMSAETESTFLDDSLPETNLHNIAIMEARNRASRMSFIVAVLHLKQHPTGPTAQVLRERIESIILGVNPSDPPNWFRQILCSGWNEDILPECMQYAFEYKVVLSNAR